MRTMLSLLVAAAMMAGAAADCAPCKAKSDAVDKNTICFASMMTPACPGMAACTASRDKAQLAKCPQEYGSEEHMDCLATFRAEYSAVSHACELPAATACCEGKCTDPMQDAVDCAHDECPMSDKDKSDLAKMGMTEANMAAMVGCATWF